MKKNFIFLIGILLILSVCPRANAQIINTIAGNGTPGYSGDGGIAINAELQQVLGLAVDVSGNIYISDNDTNGYSYIRKLTPSGVITTIAGGIQGDSGDGGPATLAKFVTPAGLATDVFGNLYISDEGVGRIRKINTFGIISTVAGTGTIGYNGDGIPATAAQLNTPEYIAVDKNGCVYISDTYNSRIRKVDTTGLISTIAGTGIVGFSGDNGPATAAQIDHPIGIAVDSSANIYVADGNNVIRKINNYGTITTFAGVFGSPGFGGDGDQAVDAEFNYAINVAVDDSGNVYIDDYGINDRIRKVNSAGIISTYVGDGTHGYRGDGGPATAAEINDVYGMAFDKNGNLYLGDFWNYRVRVVVSPLTVSNVNNGFSDIEIYPNPFTDHATMTFDNQNNQSCTLTIFNAQGLAVQQLSTWADRITIERNGLPPGFYYYQFRGGNNLVANGKLVIR